MNLSSLNSKEMESSPSLYTSICNICLGKLEFRSFPDCCLHMFCFQCIDKWTDTNTSCPVCRRQIKGYSTWGNPKTHEWNSNGPCSQWQIQTSAFRRKVYARNVWVQDLSDVCEGYREFTPEFYRADESQVNRITPWLNREVYVLLQYVGTDNVTYNYVVDLILTSVLPYHSLLSREFKEVIETYFKAETCHFVHEFYHFACSDFDACEFDEYATYYRNVSPLHSDQSTVEVQPLKMNFYLMLLKVVNKRRKMVEERIKELKKYYCYIFFSSFYEVF